MERAFVRLSPENFFTVALLSGAAYLGVIGVKNGIAWAMSKAGK